MNVPNHDKKIKEVELEHDVQHFNEQFIQVFSCQQTI